MIKKVENIILKKRLRKRSEKLKRQNERIRRREIEKDNPGVGGHQRFSDNWVLPVL